MQLAIKIMRPFMNVKKSLCKFSTHGERIQLIKNKFKEHKQHSSNKQGCIKYFNDKYLHQLVQQNYCFADVVDIANSITFHHSNHKTDQQILFIAYAYNLYYTELKNTKLIFQSINNYLKQKIANRQFLLENKDLQNSILFNIKSLTNRSNNFLELELADLKNTFFKFLALKSSIINNQGAYRQIRDDTIFNMMKIVAFIPPNSEDGSYLSQIQHFYGKLVKFECNKLLDNQIAKGESLRQSTQRFIILMEIGVILGKANNKYIDMFQSLPTQFKNEQQFITYLKVIKYFFAFQLIKRIDYKWFDAYNQQLSRKNRTYRSPQAIKSFEEYVEYLIELKVNNLKIFDAYFLEGFSSGQNQTKEYK